MSLWPLRHFPSPLVLLCVTLAPAGPAIGQVRLTEVMSNVAGSDGGSNAPGDWNEYVEIFNASAAETVDLAGWSLTDGDASDLLQAWDPALNGPLRDGDGLVGTTRLAPGSYALVLDPEYNSAGASQPYDWPPGCLILTVGNTTLGDGLSTSDPIVLRDASGDTVDTFGTPAEDDDFPSDPGDGISWEKKDPDGPDAPSNWGPSLHPSGGTPGRRNSLSIEVDLEVSPTGLVQRPPSPEPGGRVVLSALVRSRGRSTAPPFLARFFTDLDEDARPGEGEDWGPPLEGPALGAGDSARIEAARSFPEAGVWTIGCAVEVPGDEDPSNDLALLRIRVGSPLGEVIFTEVMFRPAEGEPEWVEIGNRSGRGVDLSGWSFADSAGPPRPIGDPGPLLAPGSYAVLAGDTAAFRAAHPGVPSFLIVPLAGLPTLNNDSESLTLRDAGGILSDRLSFAGDWSPRAGVSLERAALDLPTQDAGNWGRSADPSGSTPGRRNSLFVELVPAGAGLEVRPAVLTPDGDGIDDRALITFSVPAPTARVRVRIFDSLGRARRMLAPGALLAGRGTLLWDGTDDAGGRCPWGLYIVLLEGIVEGQGVRVRARRPLVVVGRL